MAGELSNQDLEAGGEFYETRLQMEQFSVDAGLKCVVMPFDKYQGPCAQLLDESGNQMGILWASESPDMFLYEFDHRHDKVEIHDSKVLKKLASGMYESFNTDIQLMKANGSELKSFTLKINGEIWRQVQMGETLPSCGYLEFFSANREAVDNPYIEITFRDLKLVKKIDLQKK